MIPLTRPETKVSRGGTAGLGVGFVVWALVAYVPAFHAGVPEPVVAVLPFALAWIGHVVTAYLAPHTPRPDLSAKAAGPPSNGGHP